MPFPYAHAKAQRREAIRASKRQSLFAALRLCLIFSLLSFSVASNAQTNALSESEIKGRELAQQLCDAQPAENLKQSGSLKIRDGKNNQITVPVNFTILAKFNMDISNFWASSYDAIWSNKVESLSIFHHFSITNEYYYTEPAEVRPELAIVSSLKIVPKLPYTELTRSFASSDFWYCDLGLEFFHWPAQKILPKTTNLKRGREYTLLESTNPNPTTNGYSRVLSWIDKESGGILQAEAYDAQGKLLKVFEPKSFKKVNGQWELQEMEIRNVQTGSRTRLEFDLKKD